MCLTNVQLDSVRQADKRQISFNGAGRLMGAAIQTDERIKWKTGWVIRDGNLSVRYEVLVLSKVLSVIADDRTRQNGNGRLSVR